MTDREVLDSIFRAAVSRVDPDTIIQKCMTVDEKTSILEIRTEQDEVSLDLNQFSRVVVTGAGKATARMAKGVESILGSRISDGVIAVKPGHVEELRYVRMVEAGHPVPNEGSLRAAVEIREILEASDEDTLVINLISGGGSALLTLPVDDSITLVDFQETTSTLLGCGATIQEINTIRKHLSGIKGGRMAELAAPATVVSLILSDVTGDDLSSIASGLTAPDSTTFTDTLSIVARYGIEEQLPRGVMRILSDGATGKRPDTPGPDDEVFRSVFNVLIGSNAQALMAAAEKARNLELNPLVLTSVLTGEAAEIAKLFSGIAKDLVRFGGAEVVGVRLPACIITGGETTVTLHGDGLGGRNQEMVLSVFAELSGDPQVLGRATFLSAGTDGNDGPTDAAGGWADESTFLRYEKTRINVREYLARNDSYHALEALNALYVTGPTNTNVCDIQLLLVR